MRATRRGDRGADLRERLAIRLEQLATLARAVSADVPGLRMEFRYTAIPNVLGNDPGAAKLFDTPFMRRLETLGYERARGANPWDTAVSPYALPSATSLP